MGELALDNPVCTSFFSKKKKKRLYNALPRQTPLSSLPLCGWRAPAHIPTYLPTHYKTATAKYTKPALCAGT